MLWILHFQLPPLKLTSGVWFDPLDRSLLTDKLVSKYKQTVWSLLTSYCDISGYGVQTPFNHLLLAAIWSPECKRLLLATLHWPILYMYVSTAFSVWKWNVNFLHIHYISNMTLKSIGNRTTIMFLCVYGHTNVDIKIWAVKKNDIQQFSLHVVTQWAVMDHLAKAKGGCLIYKQPSHYCKRLRIHLPYGLLSSSLTLK